MKRTILFILPLFFVSFISSEKKHSTEDEICDSLIILYKNAIGFGNDIGKANTITLTGNFTFSSSKYKLISYISDLQSANKMKFYYKLENKEKTREGGRNEKFWAKEGNKIDTVSEAEGFSMLKSIMTFSMTGEILINYKKKGFSATYLGEIDFENTKAHKIRLSKGDSYTDYIIDTKTHYLLMYENSNGLQIFLGNYKKVKNSYFPHFYSINPSGNKIVYDKILLDSKISEKKFIIPEK